MFILSILFDMFLSVFYIDSLLGSGIQFAATQVIYL